MNILNVFFSVNFWIINKIFKNNDYPFWSTVIAVSTYEFFSILFLFEFYFFQILKQRNLLISDSKLFGFLVLTFILILNFIYYQKRQSKILNDFKQLNTKKQNLYKFLSITYIIALITLTIINVNNIRNNEYWF